MPVAVDKKSGYMQKCFPHGVPDPTKNFLNFCMYPKRVEIESAHLGCTVDGLKGDSAPP